MSTAPLIICLVFRVNPTQNERAKENPPERVASVFESLSKVNLSGAIGRLAALSDLKKTCLSGVGEIRPALEPNFFDQHACNKEHT